MTWLRDLGIGMRFAAAGGREGWARTALTAVGVGLGVAMLLVASSVPHLLDQRSERDRARKEASVSRNKEDVPKSDSTVLRVDAATEYRGLAVEGFLMRAEGARPVLPPGVAAFPESGEMAASPPSGTCWPRPRARSSGSGCPTGSPRRSPTRDSVPRVSCTSTRAATR